MLLKVSALVGSSASAPFVVGEGFLEPPYFLQRDCTPMQRLKIVGGCCCPASRLADIVFFGGCPALATAHQRTSKMVSVQRAVSDSALGGKDLEG
ncbi:MAG: hypothetical protein ACXWKP_11100 [Bradyrhizobium sp.]